MAVYVHEFLFRGRPPGSAEDPAWHVTLASVGEDELGAPTRSERTMNMSQAAEAGWALPAIIAAMSAELMIEVEAKRDETSMLRAALEETQDALRVALGPAPKPNDQTTGDSR